MTRNRSMSMQITLCTPLESDVACSHEFTWPCALERVCKPVSTSKSVSSKVEMLRLKCLTRDSWARLNSGASVERSSTNTPSGTLACPVTGTARILRGDCGLLVASTLFTTVG
jgi:hypothetical protein